MQVAEPLYSVSLKDYPEPLSPFDRFALESRYLSALAQGFDSPDALGVAMARVMSLRGAAADALSEDDLAVMQQWSKASTAAREVALAGRHGLELARFEVEPMPV